MVVRLKLVLLLLLRVLLAWLAWLAWVVVLLFYWLWCLSFRVVNPVIVCVVSFVGLCWRRLAYILYTGGSLVETPCLYPVHSWPLLE